MRLGIDLDGVVSDFNKGWIDQYNAEFGAAIPLDAVTTWDGITPLTHFTDMEAFWEWAQDFGNGSLFRNLDTHPGATETLRRLSEQHDIVILTAKPDWAVADTLAWIAEHRLPTREVHVVGMHDPKWPIPCDVYLDDSPAQVSEIHQHRPESITCRFVRPWNDPVDGVHDVHDWKGFEELVRNLPATRSSLRTASMADKE